MKMNVLCLSVNIFILAHVSGNDNKKNKPLPYFRRQVEELFEDTPAEKAVDDNQNNLVSFLVKNVKEIFSDQDEKDLVEALESSDDAIDIEPEKSNKSFLTNENEDQESFLHMIPRATRTEDVMTYENITISTTLPFLVIGRKQESKVTITTEVIPARTDSDEFKKEMPLLIEDQDISLKNTIDGKNSEKADEEAESSKADDILEKERRSCIFCNNVEIKDCGDPKNKLIPSTVCEDNGFCYSQHTPFGIVDRGCYDVHRNETLFVCACNLCNHLSMGEMPMTYSKKEEWIDDVIELSNLRRLRKSVFRDMSCLSCEVNSTTIADTETKKSCLEGDITELSTMKCEEYELCGIRAIRSQGYIWRGCLKKPLYNYWLQLCDEDLCNFDSIVSLYDTN